MKPSFQTLLKYDYLAYKYSRLSIADFKKTQFYNLDLSIYDNFYKEYYSNLKKIHSYYQRKSRIKNYIKRMVIVWGDVCLLSLTFTEDQLNSLSFESRKKKVRDWLNENCYDYFACIDFGKRTGREHYHAICVPKWYRSYFYLRGKQFIDMSYCFSSWGAFASCRPIKKDVDVYKSMNYAFKSCFYAMKSASDTYKPFHKRDVDVFPSFELIDDSECWLQQYRHDCVLE